MTLRRRMAAALLAVVLGPLLLGALAVGMTATRLADDRAAERLNSGSAVVDSAISAVCQRAVAAAAALEAAIASGQPAGPAARLVVGRGLAEAARVQNANGQVLGRSGTLPGAPGTWGDCTRGRPPASGAAVVAATVDVHRLDGTRAGQVEAALTVTPRDLADLAGVAGVGATTLVAGAPTASALPVQTAKAVAAAVAAGRQEVLLGDGQLRLRVLEPVPGRPLRTVLTTPAPDSRGLYGALALVVLGAAAAALVAANLLARTLTRPLQEVAAAAQLVAEGDLATRLPVRAHDEVGRLASTFNRMTRGMEAYVAALTAGRDQLRGTLALLGHTMSSTNDVDRILGVILESLVATTAAEAGIVLLADPDEPGSPLAGRSGLGMVARGVRPDAVWIQLGEGLLGGVAAKAEARHGRVGAAVVLSPKEPDCRTFIVVPIVGPPHPPGVPAGRLLGVLALYDRLGGDDFDDGDLVTVRSFAGQAAVAIENALLHRAAAGPAAESESPARDSESTRRTSYEFTDRDHGRSRSLRVPTYAATALAKSEPGPIGAPQEAADGLEVESSAVGRVEVTQSAPLVTDGFAGR